MAINRVLKQVMLVGCIVSASNSFSQVEELLNCKDNGSFGAGRAFILQQDDRVTIKLRTANFYSRRVKDLARDLGLEFDDANHMPVWIELDLPSEKCQFVRSNPLLAQCFGGDDVKLTFKDYLDEQVIGEATGSIEFEVIESSQIVLNGNGNPRHRQMTMATLTVSNDVAYRRTAELELRSYFCE